MGKTVKSKRKEKGNAREKTHKGLKNIGALFPHWKSDLHKILFQDWQNLKSAIVSPALIPVRRETCGICLRLRSHRKKSEGNVLEERTLHSTGKSLLDPLLAMAILTYFEISGLYWSYEFQKSFTRNKILVATDFWLFTLLDSRLSSVLTAPWQCSSLWSFD